MPNSLQPDDYAATNGTINTPDVTASGKIGRRAIKDAKQARALITSMQEAARERNLKNARIQAKANSERPFSQQALEKDALGWKSNFTTKPLPLLIAKVAPRFAKAEAGIKYLTNSALPDTIPGAAKKTEAFRREITKTIRARPGWTDLVSELSQENALFGFTCVAWLDEFHWFPKHFRQDEFLVPSGTKHLSSTAQVIALKETFLVHDLFSMVEETKSAKAAGWDVENTILAINSAVPENRRINWWGKERVLEDLTREANVGLSLENGALTVTVWHLLAEEVTGKISHYIIKDDATGNSPNAATEKDVLFEREDQFDNMTQAAHFFSFEQGNGKLHGSKGLGREIYSMAAMLDRARNEVVDRLNLAGKILIQCDDKALKRFKASIVGPALLIGQGYQISERKIESGVEEFLQLDQFLTGLLDQMAGATTPKFFEGERVTKAQVDLFASREEESRDNIIGRFLTQFARMTANIQARLCDKNTGDDDAKEMQKRLLELMTREELDTLAKMPVAETVQNYTELERQKIAILAGEAKGNPLYNQREIERRKLTAVMDEEFADAVLLPDADPTEQAEQTRLQQLELLLLAGQATAVPVSPRDNHLIHLEVMMPALEGAAGTASNTDPAAAKPGVESLHALLEHATQHFQGAQAAGAAPEELQPFGDTIQKLSSILEQVSQSISQQESGDIPPGFAGEPTQNDPLAPAGPV